MKKIRLGTNKWSNNVKTFMFLLIFLRFSLNFFFLIEKHVSPWKIRIEKFAWIKKLTRDVNIPEESTMTRQHVPTQTNSYISQRSRLLYTH